MDSLNLASQVHWMESTEVEQSAEDSENNVEVVSSDEAEN